MLTGGENKFSVLFKHMKFFLRQKIVFTLISKLFKGRLLIIQNFIPALFQRQVFSWKPSATQPFVASKWTSPTDYNLRPETDEGHVVRLPWGLKAYIVNETCSNYPSLKAGIFSRRNHEISKAGKGVQSSSLLF